MPKLTTAHPNLLAVENSLLLIVDQQSKLTSAMPSIEAALMTANTLKLCEASTLLNVPVLVTEQYPKGLGATDPAISEHLPATAQIFSKTGFSCCAAPGFTDALTKLQRQQIIMLGQEAHVCILQTAFELAQLGYEVFVVEDAVCSRQTTHKISALQRLQQQGITITNYESVLFEWLRDATHPEFKQISALVK